MSELGHHGVVTTLARAALAALALGGCTSTHDSTETGNPPVIDRGRIALRVVGDELHVIGEPRAVQPGGITIEVTTVATGDITRGPVARDGSFDVAVDAGPSDELELRAIDGDQSSEPIQLSLDASIGGAGDGGSGDGGPGEGGPGEGGPGDGGDGGALSCEQRSALASQRVNDAASGADRSCDTDDDCVAVPLNTVCHYGCAPAVVSLSGQTEIQEAVQAVAAGVCATFADDGCAAVPPPCPSVLVGSVACVRGECIDALNPEARATLADSRDTFEQLAAAESDGETYWYEEENCSGWDDGGPVTLVQVGAAGAQIVETRTIALSECAGLTNRAERFAPRTLFELYDECSNLLADYETTELGFDALGVVQSCVYDAAVTGCNDACGHGFFLRSWAFGTAPLP